MLLTSLNMLQHPSATRSIASLGRSIPMPVRQYPLVPVHSPPPPALSYSPALLHTNHPFSPPPPLPVLSTADSACYVSGRPTSTLPLYPYRQPSIPSFHLNRRGRRRRLSMTSQNALLSAPLNSYRSGKIYTYISVCVLL